MIGEWDRDTNDPEEEISETSIDTNTSLNMQLNHNYLDLTHLRSTLGLGSLSIADDGEFMCSRHGESASMTVTLDNRLGMRREAKYCMHCWMDMLSRNCEHIDTDENDNNAVGNGRRESATRRWADNLGRYRLDREAAYRENQERDE